MDQAREERAHQELKRKLDACRALARMHEQDAADPFRMIPNADDHWNTDPFSHPDPDDQPYYVGGSTRRQDRIADQNS